ncbi:MAG: hypothetical protein AAFQ53_13090 [Bacteroidota bacterium]
MIVPTLLFLFAALFASASLLFGFSAVAYLLQMADRIGTAEGDQFRRDLPAWWMLWLFGMSLTGFVYVVGRLPA